MSVEIPRCQRCATLLRNGRAVCPSCGLAVSGAAASAPAAEPKSAPLPPEKAAARANLKICPVCTQSVVVDEMVEFEGQLHCAECAQGLKAKAAKRKAS